jgi:hypothetical protein
MVALTLALTSVPSNFPRYFKAMKRVNAARKHVFAMQHFNGSKGPIAKERVK